MVSTVSVLARPGTPSMRLWPRASRHTMTRSSSRSWPTMTFLASKRTCSRSAASSVSGAERTTRSVIPKRYRSDLGVVSAGESDCDPQEGAEADGAGAEQHQAEATGLVGDGVRAGPHLAAGSALVDPPAP